MNSDALKDNYPRATRTIPGDLKPFIQPSEGHVEVIRTSGPVTFADCELFALIGSKREREFSLSTFHTSGYNPASYFEVGYKSSASFRNFEHTGFFFERWARVNTHTHPQPVGRENKIITSLVLPSGGLSPESENDFVAHASLINQGGSLNVASLQGTCLYTGAENGGDNPVNEELGWTVMSGSNSGLHFLENNSPLDRGIGIDPAIALQHVDNFGVKRHFIFLTWDLIQDVTSSGITFQNLCFGTALPGLLSQLGFDSVQADIPENFSSLLKSEKRLLREKNISFVSDDTINAYDEYL